MTCRERLPKNGRGACAGRRRPVRSRRSSTSRIGSIPARFSVSPKGRVWKPSSKFTVSRTVRSPAKSSRSSRGPFRPSSARARTSCRSRVHRIGGRAVLFTDICGSTESTERLGDDDAMGLRVSMTRSCETPWRSTGARGRSTRVTGSWPPSPLFRAPSRLHRDQRRLTERDDAPDRAPRRSDRYQRRRARQRQRRPLWGCSATGSAALFFFRTIAASPFPWRSANCVSASVLLLRSEDRWS